MHMQSRVLKNERRLFAWRGGRGTRSCEELLWLGMNNVCRVNSQPRAWLCCPSLEGLTLLCTTLCLPAVVRRAYPCPAASCYIAQLLFKNFLMSNRNSFTLYSYYFGTNYCKHKNIWDFSFSENIRNCILGQDKACFAWKRSDFRAQIDFWTISVVFLTGWSAARRHAIAIPVTIAPYYLSNWGAAAVGCHSCVRFPGVVCNVHVARRHKATKYYIYYRQSFTT